MKVKYVLLVFLLMVINCTSDRPEKISETILNDQEILVPDSVYTIAPSNISTINWDTFQKLTPREWKNKITYEPVASIAETAVPPYSTSEHRIKETQKRTFILSPEQELVKTIKIPKHGQLIQGNDTILAIKKIIAGKPLESKVKMTSNADATMNIKTLNIDNGLPKNRVNQSIVDKFGYLWFGSAGGGLMRFDGNSILNYTEEQGACSNLIVYVNKDSHDNIWVGTVGGGLMKYDGVYFYHYYFSQGFSGIFAAMTEDSSGNIWLGGESGLAKLSRVGDSEYEELSLFQNLHGLENERVDVIFEDSKKTIWIGTTTGLRSISNRKITFYDINMPNISGLLEDTQGNLWISSYTHGFMRYDGESVLKFSDETNNKNNEINCMLLDDNGDLFIGSSKQGLLVYDGSNLSAISKTNGLLSNLVFGLSKDPAGNIWTSNFGDGISKIGTSAIDQIRFAANANETRGFYGFGQSLDERILMGSDQSTVYSYYNDNFHKVIVNQDTSYPITDITNGDGRSFWCASSSNSTISNLKDDIVTHYELFDTNENAYVEDVLVDSKGVFWSAVRGKGIVRYDGNEFRLFQVDPTSRNNFYKIIECKNGNYFFIDYETIYILEGNVMRKFWTVGRQTLDAHLDQDGSLWLATNQGPVRITYDSDGKQLSYLSYSYNNKAAGSFLTSINRNKNGNLWLGTDTKGVQVLKPVLETEDKNDFRVVAINKDDGFVGQSIFANSALMDANENYWVSTKNSVARLSMASFKLNENVPQVYLSSLRVNDFLYDPKKLRIPKAAKNFGFSQQSIKDSSNIEPFFGIPKTLELLYNYNTLTFGFSALEWKAPSDIKYQYKVYGLDKMWSSPSENNFATYRNIPPGEYLLKLRAIGKSGSWSEDIGYAFTILPPWWLSLWMKAVYVLIIVLAILGFLQLRISAVQKAAKKKYLLKLKEQAKFEQGRQLEQERIARELHDGVLGSIFGIRLGLDGLLRMPKEIQKQEQEKYVKNLSDLEVEIQTISRDLSPKIKASNLAFRQLILQFLKKICVPSGLEYYLIDNSSIEWKTISDEIKFDIYRIIQEAVQNVIKHAEATTIEIYFDKKQNHLEIQISDNGIGFTKKQDIKGIGLKNILSRVKSHGGTVAFENNCGKGAKISIRFPLVCL